MTGMRKPMRTVVTTATVVGFGLFGFATTGIAGLSSDLEAAAPKRVPAPDVERISAESRPVDCPLEERTPDRRRL